MQETRDKKRKRVIRSCRECLRRKQKCDRSQPCSNCVARKVQASCIYGEQESLYDENLSHGGVVDRPEFPELLLVEATDSDDLDMSAFGYSRTNENSTLAGLKKLQIQHSDLSLISDKYGSNRKIGQHASFEVQYHNLVKRLPQEIYRQCLIQVFFDEVNWVYSILDPIMFQKQLQDWQQNSGSDLKKIGLDSLYFPALLFQVLALSLLSMPPTVDIDLEPLKQGKSINTLAAEFSHFGCEIISLLCREDPSLISIQHDFLRASWLKTSGFVSKTWHLLSQAVRQAQEIGLHEEQAPRFSEIGTPEENMNRVWSSEYRKRLWLNLTIWDSQMAMMLGRPMTIDINMCKFIVPMNCHIPKNFTEKPPVPLGDGEKPSAFNERIIQYHLSLKIAKMRNLKAHRPFPKDPTIINSLHQEIISLLEALPAYLRQQNPDTTWDIECPFIPLQRELLFCSCLSYLLALHRAHVSTVASSRVEAIKAATEILDSQHRLFKLIEPQHYKMHSIMFFTFDASVQLATILLSQPGSDQFTLQNTLKCLGQAISRLEILSSHTTLSKSALVVVRALYQKLQQENCNKSSSVAEESHGYERTFNVNFLEEHSGNMTGEDSVFPFDPTTVSFDSFDPGWMDDIYNLGNADSIEQMNRLASLDAGTIGTVEGDAWTN